VDVECDAEWTRAERILEAPFEMPPLPVAFGSGSETTPWTSGAVTLDVSQTVEIQVSPPLDAMGDPELANDFFVIVWPHHVEEPMPFGVIGPSLALELPNRAAVDGTYTLEIPASLFQPTFSDTNGELVTTHHQLDIGLRSDGASALTSVNVFPE